MLHDYGLPKPTKQASRAVVIPKPTNQSVRFLLLAVIIVASDWLSKYWAQDALTRHGFIPVWPGFNLVLVHNQGAAFGFLNQAGGWQTIVFIVVGISVAIYLGIRLWIARPDEHLLNIGLSCILGGSVGNLLDRLNYGFVVDFLDVYVASWHWPTFNVADIAISVGAGIVIVDILGLFRRRAGKAPND